MSNYVKCPNELQPSIQSEVEAISRLLELINHNEFVMSPVGRREIENDKDEERKSEKLRYYDQVFGNVSVASKGINLIPVMNTDLRKPMLPIHDPYDPPRPPGTPLPSHVPKRPHGGPYQVGFNLFFTDPALLQILLTIFSDPPDAEHVYQATKADCAYFVTTDRKTILNPVVEKQEQMRELCGDLEFISPIELLEIIEPRA